MEVNNNIPNTTLTMPSSFEIAMANKNKPTVAKKVDGQRPLLSTPSRSSIKKKPSNLRVAQVGLSIKESHAGLSQLITKLNIAPKNT